jgi:hypothetical protein
LAASQPAALTLVTSQPPHSALPPSC